MCKKVYNINVTKILYLEKNLTVHEMSENGLYIGYVAKRWHLYVYT